MDGIEMIREAQDALGFTTHSDVEGAGNGELGVVALGYLDKAMADTQGYSIDEPPWNWPLPPDQWKPADSAIENLVLAGVYIAREIDRLTWEAMNG